MRNPKIYCANNNDLITDLMLLMKFNTSTKLNKKFYK